LGLKYNWAPQEAQQNVDAYQNNPPFKIIQGMYGRKVKYKIYKYFPFGKRIPMMHDESEGFYKAENVPLKENDCGKNILDEIRVPGDPVSYKLRILWGSFVQRRRA
jgi:hypothetical protein